MRSLMMIAVVALPGCAWFQRAPAEPAPASLSASTVVGANYGFPSGPAATAQRAAPGELQLVAETGVFLKNLELIGNGRSELDGETFFGFLAPLRLRYRLGDTSTVELGAVLGHDFGDDEGLDVAEPLVRLVSERAEDVFVVAGTLLRTHWMHEALLDDVQAFRDNAEQGLQLRVDRAGFKGDYWINWQVRERSDRREQFEVGIANQARFGPVHVDGQAFVHHHGGQKNSLHGRENNVSAFGGVSLGLWRSDAGSEVRLPSHALWNENESNFRADTRGRGWESRLSWTVSGREGGTTPWAVRTHASWFSGDGMDAVRGDPLYTVDDYVQLGTSALFDIGDGMQIETAVVLQWVDSNLNYTFQIYVTAADAFSLWRR